MPQIGKFWAIYARPEYSLSDSTYLFILLTDPLWYFPYPFWCVRVSFFPGWTGISFRRECFQHFWVGLSLIWQFFKPGFHRHILFHWGTWIYGLQWQKSTIHYLKYWQLSTPSLWFGSFKGVLEVRVFAYSLQNSQTRCGGSSTMANKGKVGSLDLNLLRN